MKDLMMQCLGLLEDATPMPARIQKLREQYFAVEPSICAERGVLITESYKETEGEPQILRRAKAFDKILSEMTIYVNDGGLLVGNLGSVPRSAPIFPEFAVDWVEKELNGDPYYFPDRPGDAYQIDEETRRILLEEVIPYWKGKTHEDRVKLLLPEEAKIACQEVRGSDEDWIMTGGDGHIIADYRRVIREGLQAVIKQAEEVLASLDPALPEDIEKIPFLKAAIIADKAVLKFAARYVEKLEELKEKEQDAARRAELTEMIEICSRVPAQPARTFQEACQTMLFVNFSIQIESNGHSISFGRIDQYLYPFFIRDIESGRLSVEKAFEIMCCMWLKVNELSKLRDWPNTVTFVGNPLFQNMTLGGQTRDGRDAVNELSYMALACTKKLKMIQPSMTVRLYQGTDRKFIKEAVKVIRKVGSMPAFFNDEVIISSMLNIGYTYDDAVDYGMVGCVEPAVQGCGGGRYGAGFPNFAKWVELAVNGGKDPRTGITCQPQEKDLSQCKTFDEFMECFRQQLRYFQRMHVICGNVVDTSWGEMTPNPFLSSVVEDCIGRGKEIKQGGAKYDNTGGQNVGVISAANALATIKKVVFDDKVISAKQLMHALNTNFEDTETAPSGEVIRQILVNADSKFGNDDDMADGIAADIMRYFAEEERQYVNTRYGKGPVGGHFIPSTATVSANVGNGECVGATADGRKSGEPITEGTSAFRGTDKEGPTALLNSYAKLPNVLMPGGQLFNVKITPTSVDTEEGLDNWVSLITTLFAKKGMQIQFNIVSAETLQEAKAEPEKYKDLIVRVAGFSSYFVTLCPQVQEDIIARTEHVL